MENYFYRTRTHQSLTESLIEHVAKINKYDAESLPVLKEVAADLWSCIRHEECMEILLDDSTADIAFTLGSHVDILMDNYGRNHEFLKQLCAEHITSQLLMEGYKCISPLLSEAASAHRSAQAGTDACRAPHQSGLGTTEAPGQPERNRSYALHFWGGEPGYPLEEMQRLLPLFRHIDLTCNDALCLIPAKSILCRVNLEESECGSFCDRCTNPCNRRKNK